MPLKSKIPAIPESIFTVMSRMCHQHGAINLAQGFPDFDCDPILIDLVYKYMQAGKNQYAPMRGIPALRAQIAEKFAHLYEIKVDPDEEITITAGATQAIFTAIGAVISAGDEVIILEPAYDSYVPAIKSFGGIVVPYQLTPPQFKVDWEEVESLVTNRTKLIIINNPHNPSGQILTMEDLDQLSKIVHRHDLYLISDEVYEHIVFEGKTHTSVVRHPELYSRSFATYSFGKVFHNTGWKMGYCVAPSDMSKAFRQIHEFNVFSVNTPVQFALAEYLEDKNNYTSLSQLFEEKRDYFLNQLRGSKWKIIPSKGSYFQLLDYSNISDLKDRSFADHLCENLGVGSIPISPFYTSHYDEKVLRFCFAKKEETLKKATEILCTV